MPATADECFGQFLQNAKTRSEETTQKWEKKKTSLDSSFDNFYEQECLKMHPDLPEQALTVLRMLHSKAKDSIEAMFHTCSASQHEDAKYFGARLRKTQLDVMKVHEHKLQISKEETNMVKVALKNFQDKVQKRMNDQSDMMSGSTQTKRGTQERRSVNPGSGGLTFEAAKRRSKKTKSPRTPVFLTSSPSKAAPKRQNQKLEPIVEPATRNVAARSYAISPARNFFREQSAHPSPEASPPARDPSASRKSRSPKSNQSHYEAFKDGKFDDLHPMMRGSIETASELNQEYEDNLVMVNDTDLSGLENMNDDEDEWQDEDYVPRRSFDELSARNSRLVDENRDLDETNEDLREKNDKFQEMVNELTNAKEGLEREIGELHLSLAPDRGLPADTNQTDVTTWASAGPDLDIPSSPEETEQREVPAMLDTPPTAGKVKSSLSVPPSPSSHHNVPTGTSKLTSPVSPGPSDTVSSNGSIQGTPTKASAPIPGPLYRFNTSTMGSSQYPDSMSGIVALLRAAVARCNSELQMCQKEMKTSLGHETSSKFVLECWQNATKKHRHDFHQTVMYFESVKTKPPPSKHNSRAGSSSFGGPTRSFGSSPPSSSMGNSFESDFVGGSQWDAPERVSPEYGNAPEPAGPKGKPHEPERVQESSPMEGSSDKKGSTQEGSFSSSGDGSKKSQSEPKPQTQPQDSQDSQESSGLRARTRGFEASAFFQYWLIVFFYWGLPFIKKRGTDSSLAAIFPVLTFYCLRFDRWMDRQVGKRLPSYASLINAAIAMILTIVFFCLYVKTYNVYLVLLRERNMWLEANRMASTLMLKRAAMSSKVSVWGLSEEQGLIRGVGNFVEFMCWSLGITTLKDWILEECVVVCQFFNSGILVLTTLFRIGIHKVKVTLFGGP
ncbi:hypothetical protein FVEN_g2637 [Fusarium venenatum]|nr:hypothetical protein FVEN_g2637 [Fusarium venenatum]